MSDAGLVDVVFQGRAVSLTHSFLHRMLDGHLSRALQEGRLDGVELAAWWRPLDGAQTRGHFTAILVAFISSGEVPTRV